MEILSEEGEELAHYAVQRDNGAEKRPTKRQKVRADRERERNKKAKNFVRLMEWKEKNNK